MTFMPKGHAKLIIADSETNADLYWATHFFVPDPVIFLEKNGRRYLAVNDLEYDRARKEAAVDKVFSHHELLQNGSKKAASAMGILDAFLKRLQVQSVEVPPNFAVKIAEALRKKKYRLKIGDEPFFPQRAIKTKAEKEAIRRSLKGTERAIGEAIATLRRSQIKGRKLYLRGKLLTSERLRQVIHERLMQEGLTGKHTIVAGGAQAADPHCTGFGPLRAHEAIVLDVFPRSDTTGYHADITRTVVAGRAPEIIRKMHHAVQAAQAAGIQKIRAGIDASRVHAAVCKTLVAHGFKTERVNGSLQGFIHSTGHGLGLDIHEFPRVSKLKNKLLKGHVVTVEPGLYYPQYGGVRIEDVVYVTQTGCERLTSLSQKLEIL